ncbi:MAG TPA: patatin-like phospholipase family protein [Candidatus Mcinerneyibacteriales bacterium]|jgi:NTE family protein|nr:patatin-like phospholipase family protein [Candidatus Mcinerneyibacteriales bacterium]HPJ70629.1 patatin-like phospholipase family protein [Candidatus Mcinerneyibacteriales bacterium]HPQ88964.1 patatin-like phospholipase family protein [Candidatus Mcinerneyibacteriales bacterium]
MMARIHFRSKKKIGVALSGGAAHGLAHIGVLKVLEEHDIPVSLVTGTSVGAIIGALWASGYKAEEIYNIAEGIRKKDILKINLPKKGIFSLSKLEEIIKGYIPHNSFESLEKPFGCVATHLNSGRALYLTQGPLARAVAASCAVPVVFSPVEIDGESYVDGGLVENVPVGLARHMGASRVIGVSLDHFYDFDENPDTIFRIMAHSIYLLGRRRKRSKRDDEGDIVVAPAIDKIDYDGLDRLEELYEKGYQAAKKVIKKIESPFIVTRR